MAELTHEAGKSKRRPIGVWVISVLYVLSTGYTLLSFALIFSGAMKITAEQQEYFSSLTSVDWLFTLAIGIVGFSAAVCLFLLRRVAVSLFSVALSLNVAATVYQMMRANLREAMGSAGLVGMMLAWLVVVAVILYTRRLAKRGVLS